MTLFAIPIPPCLCALAPGERLSRPCRVSRRGRSTTPALQRVSRPFSARGRWLCGVKANTGRGRETFADATWIAVFSSQPVMHDKPFATLSAFMLWLPVHPAASVFAVLTHDATVQRKTTRSDFPVARPTPESSRKGHMNLNYLVIMDLEPVSFQRPCLETRKIEMRRDESRLGTRYLSFWKAVEHPARLANFPLCSRAVLDSYDGHMEAHLPP